MRNSELFKVGDWTVDPNLNRITREDEERPLRRQVMALLVYLARRDGQIALTQDLFDDVWPNRVISDATLYNAVAELRRALEIDSGGASSIQTIPKMGYRLMLPVADVPDSRAAEPNDTRHRRKLFLLGSLIAVASTILLWPLWQAATTQSTRSQLTAPPDISASSVAVLPFLNLSADQDNEYFSDGLTETLLHMLTQLKDLKVAARTSSFAFKNQDIDIRNIAATLGVAHVLEGSVQKSGNEVRVTAQLIRADDGFHVWSQSYDRQLDDVFAIQDEIASSVASALGSSLLTARESKINNVDTNDVVAYDLYLRALEQQNVNSADALEEAERLFAAAIQQDPDFVDAKLGLARNFIWQWFKDVDDFARYDLEAQNLLHEVLTLRPDNLPAQLMDLILQVYIDRTRANNWSGYADPTTQSTIDEIVALASGARIDSFLTRAVVNLISGYPRYQEEEALKLLGLALESDPLNFELLWAQANLFENTDRPVAAKQPLLVAAKLAPRNPMIPKTLGRLAWLQGELAEALHWYRQAFLLDRDDPSVMSRIASAFYEMGMLAEGDYWAMLVRTRNPDACLISMLETESAELAEDYDRLLETVRRGLTIAVSRERFCFAHVDYYLWTMSKLGRSQEAIDFLSELVPGLRNYAIVAGENKNVSYIHAMSAFLHVDLMDAEDFRDMVAGFVNAWYEHNAPINAEENNHAPVYLISMEFGQGNLEAAKTIFLDSYTSMSPWRWKQFLNFPWLKEFRDNPQVAPVVDEYLLSQAVAKKKVREMLKQPEWRKCYGDPQCGA